MPGGSTGAVSILYSGRDQGGTALVCGSSDGDPRYDVWTVSEMISAGAHQNVRSGSVFASSTGASALILFQGYSYFGSRFRGPFIQYTNNHSANQQDFDLPDSFYFDPGGGSVPLVGAMLVLNTQRRNEIRVSYRDVMLERWNDLLNEQLAEVQEVEITLLGDPLLTWTAFPEGEPHLSGTQIYLLIEQDILVDTDVLWASYNATFRYWWHFHRNQGRVTAQVHRYQYWVESGMLSDFVGAVLDPHLQLGAIRLEEALNQALNLIPNDIHGIYYLPGRQLNEVPVGAHSVYRSETDSDVTVVFER